MKRYLLFILLLIIPILVYADDSCNQDDIIVESITLTESNGYVEETSNPSLDNNSINLGLKMNVVNDNVVYKLVVKNTSDQDYVFDKNSLSSEYLNYDVSFEDNSDIVKAGESKNIYLTVKYVSKPKVELLDNGVLTDNPSIVFNLGQKELSSNPNTKDSLFKMILVLIISFVVLLILTIKYRISKKAMLSLLLLVVGIPVVYALCTCSLAVNVDLKIEVKDAIFLPGNEVNVKMKKLAGNNNPTVDSEDNNIKSIKYSEVEPSSANKSEEHIVSIPESDYPIYMWFEDGVIYVWSETTVPSFNRDSSYMFSNLNNLKDIDFSNFDLSNTTNVDNIFENSSNLEKITTPKVYPSDSNVKLLLNDKYADKEKNNYNELDNTSPIETLLRRQYPVTELINWAVQDNNGDGVDEILIISDKEVTGSYYGSFDGNTEYTSSNEVPWSSYIRNVSSIIIDGVVAPVATAYWFNNVGYDAASVTADLTNLKTNNVTNMSNMFSRMAYKASSIDLNLNDWDTSNVTNMSNMFYGAGASSTLYTLELGGWDTSNVTDMSYMFYQVGEKAETLTLDLNGWNTSKVTNMSSMFFQFGGNVDILTLNLSNWDTSNVVNMKSMFGYLGHNSSVLNLDVSGWNTSNVTNMDSMFQQVGYNVVDFNLDLSDFDTLNVTSMQNMFINAGYNSTTFNLDLSSWDTSSVKYFNAMFHKAGLKATTFNLNIGTWNTSSALDMNSMFYQVGSYAETFSLDLSGWNTSNVTTFEKMFYFAGNYATNVDINMSGWDTYKVGTMLEMLYGVGYNATSVKLNLNGWILRGSVKNMFGDAGRNATTFILDLTDVDCSNVSSWNGAFYSIGKSATTWSVIIPKTNGNGINNTTTKLFGSSSEVYVSPDSGREFTLAQ